MEISKKNKNTNKKVNIFLVILVVVISLVIISFVIWYFLSQNNQQNNPQEFVNNWVMKPDNNEYFKYNDDTKKLCLADYNTKNCKNETRYDICPYSMTFQNNKCIQIKSIPKLDLTYDPNYKFKIILTHYAIETYSQMASSRNAFQTYLSDMIINFCKPRGISVFSMYLNPNFTKDSRTIFPWYGDNEWIYNNFIKVCYDNGIEPAFNVYPSFKDSMWKKDTNGSSWYEIGKQIKEINEYSNGQKSGNIVKFLIYDNEECNCISSIWKGDPLVFVRTELKKGYPNLPDDFTILSSGDVGQSFQNKKGYDIGLGEVYWNIGQAEPCVGNASQYNNYAPVCKEGSSHRRYVNQPKEYLEFLINSSKQSGTSLPVENYKKGNTVPLFSTESLYAEDGMIGRCTQLSYWGKQSQTKIPNPETSDKICGTFDGFSYWDWDKFREFLSLYAKKFDCKYVGIYDAMFIPSNWMKDGKFNNDEYNPKLDKNWPNV
tara:strand:- start:247 stop:1707 length:1461 start_codon:yes stop_codon:yes gene_type:complete